ncbi:hypothetical protein Barb6XT_01625 [Bacteroidales bacterium Barb6XT]|nr:hypothetical protein Barb6XT_01625 [Bacteroidales bacterium Barb6XT]
MVWEEGQDGELLCKGKAEADAVVGVGGGEGGAGDEGFVDLPVEEGAQGKGAAQSVAHSKTSSSPMQSLMRKTVK